MKSSSDQPYINDWACVSGCNYLEPIVDSLFGIDAGLFGGISAKPQFGTFDPKAQLSSNTRSNQNTKSFSLIGLLSDVTVDVAVDDVIA